ncbi:unnamed protein product [Trichogramma brassicae]|uniref:DNA/RNA-binding protein Kin17 WH-like domain-containing protein n=1 Tax=Trichogramma brassicae TaxID=86971 RepID=A0A6H5IFI2_9HYME|nr:unnamed protein product [Trichogramma brassicae]
MGKHEVGTPKYIANKMKAKGLQKLRWYCQMCQKQCRDENGFKCHTMSESHHRQLLLFADNSHKYMDQFSKEFSHDYLYLLKRQFGTKRVPANRVYQDYIADRNHIHMNATQWLTLTAFVKWLGRTGKCVVDETEKGWFVTYIDKDPETIAASEKKEKRKNGPEINRKTKQKMTLKNHWERTGDKPLVLGIKLKPKTGLIIKTTKKETLDVKIKQEPISDDEQIKSSNKRKLDSIDEKLSISKRVKKEKDEDQRDLNKGWLRPGLSVKIITKSLGDKYYKSKGIVTETVDKNKHLETVIPSIGRDVMILYGKYGDKLAVIEKVREDEFCVDVTLKDEKKLVKRIPYEQISKYVKK